MQYVDVVRRDRRENHISLHVDWSAPVKCALGSTVVELYAPRFR